MNLKLDDGGHAIIEDGKPVYVVDGKDVPYDVPAMMDKIRELNNESAERRVRVEELEAQVKAYKGIDAKEAREALKFRKALGSDADPKRIAEQVASLEAEREGLVAQLEEAEGKLKSQDEHIWHLTVSHDIAASNWVKENVIEAFTSDRLERLYGDNFKIEGGKPVAYVNGKKLMSRERPGEPADVNEALSIMIGEDKSMLRAGNASGGGSTPTSRVDGQLPSRLGQGLDLTTADSSDKAAYIKEHGPEAWAAYVDRSLKEQ